MVPDLGEEELIAAAEAAGPAGENVLLTRSLKAPV